MIRAAAFLCILLASALAAGAAPLTPAEALACAAARFRGEALALRAHGEETEIRWLTPAGNVLRIRLEAPGCRFLEVEGVGQTEARILPEGRE
ncbi:MAG: Cys/Met metabolism pyridoxal-phosphate-dependent enzyme [Gemmobacter sp.]